MGSEEETLKAGRAASLQPWQQRSAMAALQEKKSCGQRMEEFRRYCWNPDTGQMLGRTLSRWGLCAGPGEGRGRPAAARDWRSQGPDQAPPASRPRRQTPKACPGPDTPDPGYWRVEGS